MKILAQSYDRSLGGRDFDEALFKHFATEFKEKYKIDVHSNGSACGQLRTACEKMKKELSGNSKAQLSIVLFMDEKDVRESTGWWWWWIGSLGNFYSKVLILIIKDLILAGIGVVRERQGEGSLGGYIRNIGEDLLATSPEAMTPSPACILAREALEVGRGALYCYVTKWYSWVTDSHELDSGKALSTGVSKSNPILSGHSRGCQEDNSIGGANPQAPVIEDPWL